MPFNPCLPYLLSQTARSASRKDNTTFLAHQIGISVVFTHEILSYIAIPASGKDNKQTAARWPHTVRTSIRVVTIMSKIMSQCCISAYSEFSGSLFHVFLQYKMLYIVVSKKKIIHYSCEDGIEKSVHQDHRLSSFGRPRDASR